MKNKRNCAKCNRPNIYIQKLGYKCRFCGCNSFKKSIDDINDDNLLEKKVFESIKLIGIKYKTKFGNTSQLSIDLGKYSNSKFKFVIKVERDYNLLLQHGTNEIKDIMSILVGMDLMI